MYILLVSLCLYFECIQSANILGIFPFPSPSHQIVFQAIWRELSLQGHNVTVVTPNTLNNSSLTNLTEISVRNVYDLWNPTTLQNVMSKKVSPFENVHLTFSIMNLIDEIELKNEQFQNLIKDQNAKFDLIMIEFFHTMLHSLSRRYQAPVIGVSSFGAITPQNDLVGNPNHQVLYPDFFLSSYGKELTFFNKLRHVLFGMWFVYHHQWYLAPKGHEMANKYFGNSDVYVGDLERNWSMLYYNSNPLLRPSRSNVPLVLEFSQIHIKPVKPLPKDLQQILDEAKEGVVYLSFGSNKKSTDLDDDLRNIIIQALSELPYKVIWKWEADYLPNKPPNVIIKKWLPQQDLLAHPNIRVFITQGGLQSVEEAIDRGVPMVGLAFLFDQIMNTQNLVEFGIGISLDPFTVTAETLKNSIVEIAENSSYRKRILEVRRLLSDKRRKSIEDIVWWTEYVIRHKGAKHLRSPSADISWFHYLMLDVIFIFVIILSIITYGCYKLLRNCYKTYLSRTRL